MPSVSSPTTWKKELDLAVRRANAEVIGVSLIRELHHARLLIGALSAVGDDPRAIFFIEGKDPDSRFARPDLILVHPDIGVLVIENKGIELSSIHGVHNTLLTLVRDGRLKEEDPFHQAERVMFQLKDLASSRMDPHQATFSATAALPCITRAAFQHRFDVRWPPSTIFADELSSPELLKQHLLAIGTKQRRQTGRETLLSQNARAVLLTILNGRAYLTAPRRAYIEESDPELLGVRVQELELALKEPTHQQKEIGRKDLRGHHWLFRGVAGSGKSLMLTLSVSQTLMLYQEEASGLFKVDTRRVLVVCYNRTLVHHLKHRIAERYTRVAWEKPPANMLRVQHLEGLIRSLEAAAPELKTPFDFKARGQRATAMRDAFDKLAPELREALQFDAVYIDEAQDLEPEEFGLLLALAKKNPGGDQTFVVFYDNAQNIYGATAPNWSQLGVNIVGRTTFLDECLRNTREVLSVAFNVLVGSYAPPGERVTTRKFADLESLRQRNLIAENGDHVEVLFASRRDQVPYVRGYPDRESEIAGAVEIIRRLIHKHRVIPSDILVLYRSHLAYRSLGRKLKKAIGDNIRFVDREHAREKNQQLFQDGVLTVSTIASAKGYDAPVVLLLGVDELSTSVEDRARFYVGATRAKLILIVTGIEQRTEGLFFEAASAARAFATSSADIQAAQLPTAAAESQPPVVSPSPRRDNQTRCSHCGSPRLHAQQGGNGYYFICIDCTEKTNITRKCTVCSSRAYVRKTGRQFFRKCSKCGSEELLHTNVPLDSLFR